MLSPRPTYLLASAEPEMLARVQPYLARTGVEMRVALSGEAALAVIAGTNKPDLILLDAALPGMPAEQFLAAARSQDSGQRLPIVLIAGTVTQEWLDRIDEGILDDLIPCRSEPAYWQLRAASALRAGRLLQELDHLRENETRHAQMDRLTGVYNREGLLSLLFRETDRVQRMSSPLTVLLFDVDDFGHWNSRLGSDACDEILREIARRTARLLRSYDLLGRAGKDEFLIALPGCSVANAVALAERLRLEVFSAPYRVCAETVRLSVSFGVAESRGRSPVVVLREAEQALAQGKEIGPEAIQVYSTPPGSSPAPVTFLSSDSGEELLAW